MPPGMVKKAAHAHQKRDKCSDQKIEFILQHLCPVTVNRTKGIERIPVNDVIDLEQVVTRNTTHKSLD